MPRAGVFVGIAAAAFLVFLVRSVPAALLGWFTPEGVELSTPTGSLWAGEVSALRVGDLRLGKTRWTLEPWQLIAGRLAGEVDASLPGGFARGDFAVGIGGSFSLADFSVAGPLAELAKAFGSSLPIQDGQLSVNVVALDVSDGWPTRAVGEVAVGDVAILFVRGRPVPDQLASFRLQVDAQEIPAAGTIEGTVTDQGGPLEVIGVLQLSPPGNYVLSGRASPRPGAPQTLQQALVLLGPETREGGREFSFAGSL